MSGDYNWIKPVQTLPNLQVGQSLDWREVDSVPENNKVHNAYNETYLENAEKYMKERGLTNIIVEREDDGDISDEEYRHYIFDDKRSVMIVFPQFLYIDSNDDHVVVDREGVYHVIPQGWIQMEIEFIDA